MNNLYIIGGSPRCGKSIILEEFMSRRPILAFPSDAIRAGIRYLNSHGRINFDTTAIEDQLPWEMMVGIINRYDNKNIPLILEGVVITPERIKNLKLDNLIIKTVFVGFTGDEYIENVINFGKENNDWVSERIIKDGGESGVRDMLLSIKDKNKKIKEEAERFGYKFISPDNKVFEEYVNEVVDCLLN